MVRVRDRVRVYLGHDVSVAGACVEQCQLQPAK